MTHLASDEISIRFDNETVRLRPTLRAAMRLERQFHGFDAIIRGVLEQNVGVMAAIVAETADADDSDLICFLEAHTGASLHVRVCALVAPLLSLVLSLAGVDEDRFEEDGARAAERIAFAEYHAQLYRIATGWLGWNPETAWEATPNEIVEAYHGRLDMLSAIFGSGDGQKQPATSEAALASFLRSRKAS